MTKLVARRALGDVFRDTLAESAARAEAEAKLAAERAREKKRRAARRDISLRLKTREDELLAALTVAVAAAAEGRVTSTPKLAPVSMGGDGVMGEGDVRSLPAFKRIDTLCRRENIYLCMSVVHESGWRDYGVGSSSIHLTVDFTKPYAPAAMPVVKRASGVPVLRK